MNAATPSELVRVYTASLKNFGRGDPKVVSRNQPKTSVGRPGMESMIMLITMILITSMIEEKQYIRRGSDAIISKMR